MKTIADKEIAIAVIGLGYVGLPLALVFSKRYQTIAYDCNLQRIEILKAGHDSTLEVDDELLQQALNKGLILTCTPEAICSCNVYVITVPTPVDIYNHPDLNPLIQASATVGKFLKENDVVIYESTVYPGVTEEECVPVLEKTSGLQFNKHFFVGYSPERINPGDKQYRTESICKVTSGSTPQIADFVNKLYDSVLSGGTYRASSIRVAEASKIIENTQRDVNIAFMNELAKIFNAMNIDTNDVIEAAATKWNFIKMKPGLVGGHCIGVDPYYLIDKAQSYGVLPRIMSAARQLNDAMGEYVANQVIKLMNLKGITVKDSKILILGFTFKENCPDIRNTKVIDIYKTLQEYTQNILVCDPLAEAQLAENEYSIKIDNSILTHRKHDFDAIILTVAHDEFLNLPLSSWTKPLHVIYDVKSVLDKTLIDGRL